MSIDTDMEKHDSVMQALVKALAWLAALIGSIKLADVQAAAGLFCTLVVTAGACVSLYTALRRKAWKDPPK